MSESWTIRELCQKVEDCLAEHEAPSNGQIRAVPDERSVRYYTSIGLLDRPTLRGRTALYGLRHLAQLVAIKRYQSQGRTLAEIQQVLPAMDDASLSRFTSVALSSKRSRAAVRRDFWREPPREIAASEPTKEALETVIDPGRGASATLASYLELELAPGVRLAFNSARVATDADATALLSAAEPLLAELVRRHLISAHTLEVDPSNP